MLNNKKQGSILMILAISMAILSFLLYFTDRFLDSKKNSNTVQSSLKINILTQNLLTLLRDKTVCDSILSGLHYVAGTTSYSLNSIEIGNFQFLQRNDYDMGGLKVHDIVLNLGNLKNDNLYNSYFEILFSGSGHFKAIKNNVLLQGIKLPIRIKQTGTILTCGPVGVMADYVVHVVSSASGGASAVKIQCPQGELLVGCSGARVPNLADTCDEEDCGMTGFFPYLGTNSAGCFTGADADNRTAPTAWAFCLKRLDRSIY